MGQTKKYIVAHDAGTTGDKAVLTDLRGRIVHSSYLPYTVEYPRPDWAEQDPDMLWTAQAENTRRMIQEAGVDPGEILGVGFATQMLNLIPVDETGQPLMKMISWLDVRSTKQADGIFDKVSREKYFNLIGNLPTAKDTLPKILWLKEERPEIWSRTSRLLDCGGYTLYKLTGKYVTDWHGASITFMLDPYTRTWCEPLLEAMCVPKEMLSPPYPCTQVIGEVTPEAALLTGLLPGTPVVACAGDLGVAQVGAGANKDGAANLYLGTSSWIGFSASVFRNDSEKPFWALSHVDPQKWILAGEMETGGGSLSWFQGALCEEQNRQALERGLSVYQVLDELAEAIPPGSERLVFLPWLSGERAPVLDHYLRGAFVGISLGHNKAHFSRAVMEGVAYHFRWICEALEKLGYQVTTLNSIGGGSKSETWTRIISDVTGRTLRIATYPLEAGAIGAALTVAVGMGIYPNMEAVDELIPFCRTVEPTERASARYDAMYSTYRSLHAELAPVFRQLHDIE